MLAVSFSCIREFAFSCVVDTFLVVFVIIVAIVLTFMIKMTFVCQADRRRYCCSYNAASS